LATDEQLGKSSMSDQTPAALLRAGELAGAIAASQAVLRKSPANIGARVLLAELLIFSGNLERADTLMDAASAIDSTTSLVAAEYRQLLRGEIARRQLYADGRVPEFLGEPTDAQRLQLSALVAMRAGDVAEATRQSRLAEETRPRTPGLLGDARFDDFRDADDWMAGSFEVLTSTGKYFWIPTERVVSANFHAPTRVRDLIWRRASMVVSDGPEGDVYVPAIYAADEALTDALRLGRETDWREAEGGLVRGVGQRVFLAGDEGVDVMAVRSLKFAA
jgi:type VI secretion system protein ImpE